jgi:TIR domain
MTDTEGAPFVFVSYSRANRDTVDRLIGDLRSQGIDIWIDRQGLRVGTPSWEQALRDAIRAARVVLLVASPDARISPYVADELRIALMYQRTVYPFWVAGTNGWSASRSVGVARSTSMDEATATRRRCMNWLLRCSVGRPGYTPCRVRPRLRPNRKCRRATPTKGCALSALPMPVISSVAKAW